MLSLMQSATEGKAGQGNMGQESLGYDGVILIGPIPIVAGSDSRTVLFMRLILLAIMLIWVTWLKGW
jgi:uncharacterized protein (TIGR00304 family)